MQRTLLEMIPRGTGFPDTPQHQLRSLVRTVEVARVCYRKTFKPGKPRNSALSHAAKFPEPGRKLAAGGSICDFPYF